MVGDARLQRQVLRGEPAPRPQRCPPCARYTQGVRLSFPPEIAERARALARRRGTDYVTLINQFVCERLAEEEARDST